MITKINADILIYLGHFKKTNFDMELLSYCESHQNPLHIMIHQNITLEPSFHD